MTKYLSTAIAAGALVLGTSSVSATQISGSIEFAPYIGASVTVDALPGVSTVTFTGGLGGVDAYVAAPGTTGDFETSGYEGLTADFADFGIPSGTVDPLWQLSNGLTFKLTGIVNDSTATFLNLKGTGEVYGAGWDTTPGEFTLTASTSSGRLNFSFQATTTTTPTPDGGATAILLGLGAVSMGFVARRKA